MEPTPYPSAKMHDEILSEINAPKETNTLIILCIIGTLIIGFLVVKEINRKGKEDSSQHS